MWRKAAGSGAPGQTLEGSDGARVGGVTVSSLPSRNMANFSVAHSRQRWGVGGVQWGREAAVGEGLDPEGPESDPRISRSQSTKKAFQSPTLIGPSHLCSTYVSFLTPGKSGHPPWGPLEEFCLWNPFWVERGNR
jgi:hypothetical protein